MVIFRHVTPTHGKLSRSIHSAQLHTAQDDVIVIKRSLHVNTVEYQSHGLGTHSKTEDCVNNN